MLVISLKFLPLKSIAKGYLVLVHVKDEEKRGGIRKNNHKTWDPLDPGSQGRSPIQRELGCLSLPVRRQKWIRLSDNDDHQQQTSCLPLLPPANFGGGGGASR